MRLYDCVIVGAGPAGLMAARTLAKHTNNFLVIDGKKRIGVPLRCGEGVRQKEFLDMFGSASYPFVRNSVEFQDVRYQDIKKVFQIKYFELDRPQFEQWLSRPVRDKIRLQTECDNVELKKDSINVLTTKGKLRAKSVILANGCDYRLQQKLGLIKEKPALVVGYGGIFQCKGIDTRKFCYFFDDSYPGYLWCFPKTRNTANIGFGALKVSNPKRTLDKLLDELHMNAKQVSEYSGLINISGPIDKTYAERLLVCGTAAGLVFAGTGEGIHYALLSGKLAAETVNQATKKNDFSEEQMRDYELKWKHVLGHAMQGGLIFRDLLYFGFRFHLLKWLFQQPSEHELRQMILQGKIPRRALIAWKIIKKLKMSR